MVTGHRLGSAAGATTGCEVGAGVGVAWGCREQPPTTTASAAASASVRTVRVAMFCSYTQPTPTHTTTQQGHRWFPWTCFGGRSKATPGDPAPPVLNSYQARSGRVSGGRTPDSPRHRPTSL